MPLTNPWPTAGSTSYVAQTQAVIAEIGSTLDAVPLAGIADALGADRQAQGVNNVLDGGAARDGVTDDLAVFQSALDDAADNKCEVYAPPGTYAFSDTPVIPPGVRLRGAGTRATILKAGAGFPTSNTFIQLGRWDQNFEHGMRVEDLTIDCNSVSGSTGVETKTLQEPGGLRNVLIQNYANRGIYANKDGTQWPSHLLIDSCELFAKVGSTGPSIELLSVANPTVIHRTTVTTVDLGANSTTAIKSTDSPIYVTGCNLERHDIGIDLYRGVGLGTNGNFAISSLLIHDSVLRGVRLNDGILGTITGLRSHASIAGVVDGDNNIIQRYDAGHYAHGPYHTKFRRSLTANIASWSDDAYHAEDILLFDATTYDIVQFLPYPYYHEGKELIVKKTDASANTVQLLAWWDGVIGKIDGAADKTIASAYGYLHLLCDGTNWHIIGSGGTIT